MVRQMAEGFSSRRERREAERLNGSDLVSNATGEISLPKTAELDFLPETDDQGNPVFKLSSALTGEFTGANLVVETPVDITAGGTIILDSGEIVSTGSIDISALITTMTGEVPQIAIDGSDDDLDADAQSNYQTGIPPIRASGLLAKTNGNPAITGRGHRGRSPYFGIAMIAIGALVIGGALLACYLLGFLSF
jgi:hypothetical protein